ncbi:MAG: hypothetical protein ACI93R_002128 [Flavobacteriales bacterium]|jgi:hypothetical protein
MPYIQRDTKGQLTAISQYEIIGFSPVESLNLEEVALMLQRSINTEQSEEELIEARRAQEQLMTSDTHLARVTEDLIQLLIHKKHILFTDLPPVVQEKLISRMKMRDNLAGESNFGFNENDTI